MKIELDEDTHRYHTETGREIPGVGQVLEAAGISFRGIDDPVLTDFGRAIHRATELHDLGLFDNWPGYYPEVGLIEDRLIGYRLFLEQAMPEILEIEPIVYHEGMDYVGKPDRIIRRKTDGKIVALDIKTGSPQDYYMIKGAAYAMAYEWQHEIRSFEVTTALLYLCPKAYSLVVPKGFAEEANHRNQWLDALAKYPGRTGELP